MLSCPSSVKALQLIFFVVVQSLLVRFARLSSAAMRPTVPPTKEGHANEEDDNQDDSYIFHRSIILKLHPQN
jgi:hypothetical protein